MYTVNRDHDPPFLTCLQLNPNSSSKIRQIGRKKRHSKSIETYLSFPLSDWITTLVNAEKTRKEIFFIPRATISSNLTPKKIRAPDWLIASTIMQFGACPTSSGWCLRSTPSTWFRLGAELLQAVLRRMKCLTELLRISL